MAEVATVNGSAAAVEGVGAVVGPQFCAPDPVEIAIRRKPFALAERFVVTDVRDNLLFKVQSGSFSLRDKRIISDAAGNVILTLRRKLWSLRGTWQAFRGESTERNDLVFTARMSCSLMQPKLKVYLAYNVGEEYCDFKLTASSFQRSGVVYAGESNSAVVAQMQKKLTAGSLFLGKDKFMVTVNPNTDYAFIVALIVIHDANQSTASGGGAGDG